MGWVIIGQLALELATTVRYGPDGVLDVLDTAGGLTAWVREQEELLAGDLDVPGFTADDEALAAVLAVRKAVRSLFADAVSPEPPSKADANRLLSPETAVRHLNDSAAAVTRVPSLVWPAAEIHYRLSESTPARRLTAALARAGIDFLAGPDRARLRACPAPRCVRYFVQSHPKQAWCKPSCGNRARVSRHYQRHQ